MWAHVRLSPPSLTHWPEKDKVWTFKSGITGPRLHLSDYSGIRGEALPPGWEERGTAQYRFGIEAPGSTWIQDCDAGVVKRVGLVNPLASQRLRIRALDPSGGCLVQHSGFSPLLHQGSRNWAPGSQRTRHWCT
jgi:hypothetical protein